METTKVTMTLGLVSNNEGKAVTVQATTGTGKVLVGTASLSHYDITSMQLQSTMVDKHLKQRAMAQVLDELINSGDL